MRGWRSTAQAAAAIGVSPNRIRQLLGTGQLPGSRIGRDWAIKTADLERYRALPLGAKGRPRSVGKAPKRRPSPPPEHQPILPNSLLIAPEDQS